MGLLALSLQVGRINGHIVAHPGQLPVSEWSSACKSLVSDRMAREVVHGGLTHLTHLTHITHLTHLTHADSGPLTTRSGSITRTTSSAPVQTWCPPGERT